MSTDDPRIEAIARNLAYHAMVRAAGNDNPYLGEFVDRAVLEYRWQAMAILAAADATDHAAGIYRLDSHHENYIEELDSLMRQHFTKGQE